MVYRKSIRACLTFTTYAPLAGMITICETFSMVKAKMVLFFLFCSNTVICIPSWCTCECETRHVVLSLMTTTMLWTFAATASSMGERSTRCLDSDHIRLKPTCTFLLMRDNSLAVALTISIHTEEYTRFTMAFPDRCNHSNRNTN